MKIAIDIRSISDTKAGYNRFVSELIRAMKKIEPENTYIYYINKKVSSLNTLNLRKAWGRLDSHPISDIWEQIKLPIELYKERIDVYHGTIGRLPKFRKHTKYITTIHDLNPLKFSDSNTHTYNWYMSILLRQAVNTANKVIAISNTIKNDIIELLHIPEQKIQVIYEGVNKYWRPVNSTKWSDIKKKYGISTSYILAVGNLEPKKNFPRLASAFSALKDRKKIKEQLVIVGPEGWRAKSIINSAHEIDNKIIFTGYVSNYELRILYNQAKLFVFPSLYEGFGLPILEAMACGAPVVASNTTAIPEIAGNAALYFDPLNIEEMSYVIEKVICNEELRKELIKKGFDRVKKFSWEKTAKETLELYKEVCKS
jgi:glycosyltransferase involved in cell wall biosynthesis